MHNRARGGPARLQGVNQKKITPGPPHPRKKIKKSEMQNAHTRPAAIETRKKRKKRKKASKKKKKRRI